MPNSSDLDTPILLLAMPQIQDPFFHRSVVLLLAHEDEGSFGFVVNRPSNLKVATILHDLELDWGGGDEDLAYVGGPVKPQLGTVLLATPDDHDHTRDGLTEVAPGVCITQSLDHLDKLAEKPHTDMRLVLGYAGWSMGQLETEIGRHDWLVAEVDARFVFETDPVAAWTSALASVGIDPATLPNWTTDDQQAN